MTLPRSSGTDHAPSAKNGAVATPYVEGYDPQTDEPIIYWEWNICPDCGKKGAHHRDPVTGRGGIRCG